MELFLFLFSVSRDVDLIDISFSRSLALVSVTSSPENSPGAGRFRLCAVWVSTPLLTTAACEEDFPEMIYN